jgi:hypothetical protein
MSPDNFDHRMADAFLAGRIPTEDAPPGYRRAAALIQAARSPASMGELAAEDQVVAALLAQVHGSDHQVKLRRTHVLARALTVKASVLAAILFGGGVAVAATGSMPAPVQSVITAGLSAVGLASSPPSGFSGSPTSRPDPKSPSRSGSRESSSSNGGAPCSNAVSTGVKQSPEDGVTTLGTDLAGQATTDANGGSNQTCSQSQGPSQVPTGQFGNAEPNGSQSGPDSGGASDIGPSPGSTTPTKNTNHPPHSGNNSASTSTTIENGAGNGNGIGNRNGTAKGNGTGNGSVNGNGSGNGAVNGNGSGNGAANGNGNGNGTAKGNGTGNGTANANGNGNGTANGKGKG